MGYVLMAFREIALVQEKNHLEAELQRLTQKKNDLHKYASAIARDGILSVKEMAGMPNSCFGLAQNYALSGHGNIIKNTLGRGYYLMGVQPGIADQNIFTQAVTNPAYARSFQAQHANGLLDMTDAQNQERAKAIYFANEIQRQMAKEQAEAEKERIKAIEDDIDAEKTNIETQLNAVNTELKSVGEAKKQDIQNEVAKYA